MAAYAFRVKPDQEKSGMKKLFGVGAFALSAVVMSYGQAVSVNGGSISGTITDPTGAVVPNAVLVIKSSDTGFSKTLKSDSAGFYNVGPLNPGNYTVNVSGAGFQSLTATTVVRTGTATSGNFKLTLGQSNETVEVTEGAVQVNTDQIGVSDVITKAQIDSLPVNGRNFLDLAGIEPGVILQSGESFDPTKAGYSAISLSGVSGRTTRILLDGQDITDETVGTTIFNVAQGAINEFQLNRSTQDVSGEVTSTGQVLVSTNSGTNAYHGQAFYNFQDHRALFARSLNGQDPQFQRNQFGGYVGGPIIKNKLFFFGDIERIKQDSSSVSPVLTGSTALFNAIAQKFPFIPSPYRETYSTARLDYNGPKGAHFFVRANYNVNSVASNAGYGYALYANRDNTPGLAGGADFATGKFTHSFRGSYEKFHNLISDKTAGNSSVYDGVPSLFLRFSTQNLFSGPNFLAPQATFQSDKQARYDGTWTKGAHLFRFGYSINRILGGGFAAFYGLSPYATESTATLLSGSVSSNNPLGYGCNNVVGAAACPNDPANGYHINTAVIGNGQGFFTENPGFGLAAGGVADWREGAYVSDNWKITPKLTLVAGVRWSVDTDRANQDVMNPLCSDVDTASAGTPCTGSASLFAQWNPAFGGTHVHQPYGNFGPQFGLNYAPGNGKTSLHAGIGIYFEGDVFNNTTNARSSLLKQGAFFDDKLFCKGGGGYSVIFPDGTTHTTTPDGSNIQTLCSSSAAKAGPQFAALQAAYQANTKANAIAANGGYVGETLQVAGVYAPTYRTPYSEQWNFGIEHELFRGATVSANYIHNTSLHISQSVDQNHVGAARYLNTAAATFAIAATTTAFGCTGTNAAAINCAIAAGAKITDFAGNGLDSGNQYQGGYNSIYYYGVPASQGAAFAGANPALGNGDFLIPIGRSGYDALQIVYKQVTAHPVRGVDAVTFQGSYSRSRIVGSSGGGSDQFFSSGSIDNDNPNEFMGRTSLDHSNELSFGGSVKAKYGPMIGFIGHFYSAPPSTLILDATVATGGIFQSDITGDGSIGDVAPGTVVGNYMHGIDGKNLRSYVSNFNATQAGQLTPAGKALVASGLFNSNQLTALNAVIQPIAQVPQATALNNPSFRSVDVNLSYPIRLARFREGLSLEPTIAFYNVFNMSNYSGVGSGTLYNTTDAGGVTNNNSGYLTGPNTYGTLNNYRVQRGSGTFDQGAQRSTEFQLKLNF
jgi:hypothetical protein